MVASVLTPLQLNAAAGLLQNTGFGINANLTQAIASYANTGLIAPFLNTISVGSTGNILAANTLVQLETLAANTCPALSDSVPTAYSNIGNQMIAVVNAQAVLDICGNNTSKLVQAVNQADSYVSQTNIFISSAVNSQNYLSDTFTTTNNMITGGITLVNLNTTGFGADLVKLGKLINLGNLNNLGSPLALVQQLYSISSTIPVLSLAFVAAGVSQDVVLNLNNPTATVVDSAQALMYRAMTNITGTDLAQVLSVFGVTTAGINTMADLLNPVKLFPNSFQTLTVPAALNKQTVAIYVNSSGSVNTELTTLLPPYVISSTVSAVNNQIAYDRLSQIIPADQALANKALATSLQQINNITNMSLPTLANTVSNIQTTSNLDQVSALTQAVPATVANSVSNIAGTGGNTIGICNILGIAAGYEITDQFVNTAAALANTNVSYLTTIYQTMSNVVSNVYGNCITGPVVIPVGQPAAGSYYANATLTAADTAMLGVGGLPAPTGPGLIPVAQTEIGNIVVANGAQVANLNAYFNSMAQQVSTEQTLQADAQIDFGNLIANNSPTVYSLIYNLPGYGQQTEQGGLAQFWQGVANLTTFTGQCLVATMRQGINQLVLSNAGIQTSSSVPVAPNPPPPQANLLPATYTAQQAAASINS